MTPTHLEMFHRHDLGTNEYGVDMLEDFLFQNIVQNLNIFV